MVIALVLLFVMAASLSFIEDRLSDKDKKMLYVLLGIAMILIAGLREVGSTPDSNDYERMFYGKSDKVLEAATVDGATSRQSFFRVTLPLLGPSMTTCIFMSLTNGLKVFDIILALTKGGPGTSTYSATLQIYNDAFTKNMYGLGSAEAMLYFFAVLLITQIVLRVMSRKEVEL